MNYTELRKINVAEYVEKKNGLSYLSWAWAVDQLLQRDPAATWDYRWAGEVPFVRINDTAMVFCTVRAFGVERTAQLPVMDHRNKPIPNPDSFAVNTAMQRCLAKAISLHGIGLYIYAGEDLPDGYEPEPDTEAEKRLDAAGSKEEWTKVWATLSQEQKTRCKAAVQRAAAKFSAPKSGTKPAGTSSQPATSEPLAA